MYCLNKTYALICDCCWRHLDIVDKQEMIEAVRSHSEKEKGKYTYKVVEHNKLGFGWLLEAERIIDSGITGWVKDGEYGHLCSECAEKVKENTNDITEKGNA